MKQEEIIVKLKQMGCDVDGAMSRVFDDIPFYFECLDMVIYDDNFDGLQKAYKEKNIETAFNCAHALKGILANVGLTPVYNIVVIIVESLRAKKIDGLDKPMADLIQAQKEMIELIKTAE